MFTFYLTDNYIYITPVKKHSKKGNQAGGWFYEKSDPIFGASNRWIGDKVLTPTNKFLKKQKYYQQ